MTTIMTWGNSEGTKGRCDDRCHSATGPICRCCCGGRYHGSARQPGGVEQAVRDNWEDAIREAEQKAKAEGKEIDTSGLRRLIGLADDDPMVKLEVDLKTGSYHGAVQGRLPLEVSSGS